MQRYALEIVWLVMEQRFCAADVFACKGFRSGSTHDGRIRWICTSCPCTSLKSVATIFTASSIPRIRQQRTTSLKYSFGCRPELRELQAKFTLFYFLDFLAAHMLVGAHSTSSRLRP